jgi:hypothetical protein
MLDESAVDDPQPHARADGHRLRPVGGVSISRVVLVVFKGLPLLGTPIAIGIAWWIWLEGDRETRALRVIGGAARAPAPWRVRVLLLSLAAGSANALIFYAWLAYRLLSGASPQVWKVQAILSNVAGYLILAVTCPR